MTRRTAAVALAVLAVVACGRRAEAQPPGGFPRRHSIEMDLGGTWASRVGFGTIDAGLTRNQVPEAPYALFATSSTLGAAFGAEARVGWHVTAPFAVEGSFQFSRPSLVTSVTGDVEGAPDVEARETLSRFLVDVSGVWHVRRVRLGRAVPFVLGGAGYLRELHDGGLLVETGHTYHAGGGLRIPIVVRRGFVRSLGVRVDGRVYLRTGGSDLDEARPARAFGVGGASLVLGF